MSPSLDPVDRRALLGPLLDCTCPLCHQAQVRHYCRSCDEFFTTCTLTCPVQADADRHMADHRVYLWTAAGMVAIPDFDVFLEVPDRS